MFSALRCTGAEKARAAHEASQTKLAASSTEATRKRNEYLLAIVALNAELLAHSSSDFPELLAAAGAPRCTALHCTHRHCLENARGLPTVVRHCRNTSHESGSEALRPAQLSAGRQLDWAFSPVQTRLSHTMQSRALRSDRRALLIAPPPSSHRVSWQNRSPTVAVACNSPLQSPHSTLSILTLHCLLHSFLLSDCRSFLHVLLVISRSVKSLLLTLQYNTRTLIHYSTVYVEYIAYRVHSL